jgi:hypothetical protein
MTIGCHLSSKNLQDSQPAHVEEEDKTAQPQQSTGEERTRRDQVVLSGRDNNSTLQSEHTVQRTLNIGIMPKVQRTLNIGIMPKVQRTLNIGIMPSGHHDCKKVARQIKTGYCFKKNSTPQACA